MKDFRSDNTHGVSPEVLDAVQQASSGTMTSYGRDEITASVRERCSTVFGAPADVFPVITGSAGNALAISSLTPPWGAVFCHEDAHIQRDELGGVELYSGGAKLITIPGADGKLQPDALQRSIDEIRNSSRTAVPACVSLTNATEAGTVYSNDEMRALVDVAKRNEIYVHVDGARFANAVASKQVTTEGADILTLGATKNGGMSADCVVVFRRELTEEVALRWHRSGHRVSKMRFLSAQLDAYLTDDLWLRNARRANAMATLLREAIVKKFEILRPVEANEVFIRLAPSLFDALGKAGFLFYDWKIFGPDVYRIVMAFDTSAEDVDALAAAILRA